MILLVAALGILPAAVDTLAAAALLNEGMRAKDAVEAVETWRCRKREVDADDDDDDGNKEDNSAPFTAASPLPPSSP